DRAGDGSGVVLRQRSPWAPRVPQVRQRRAHPHAGVTDPDGNLPTVTVNNADASADGEPSAVPLRPSRVEPISVHTLSTTAEARLWTAITDTSTTVTGVTLRAHEVLPGDLFAALPGSREHGAEFAADAIAAGAAAILTDETGARMLPHASRDIPVLVRTDPRA